MRILHEIFIPSYKDAKLHAKTEDAMLCGILSSCVRTDVCVPVKMPVEEFHVTRIDPQQVQREYILTN